MRAKPSPISKQVRASFRSEHPKEEKRVETLPCFRLCLSTNDGERWLVPLRQREGEDVVSAWYALSSFLRLSCLFSFFSLCLFFSDLISLPFFFFSNLIGFEKGERLGWDFGDSGGDMLGV